MSLRLFRALSLDVLAGVACGGLLAEQVAEARMGRAWWIALLAAVWSIYTADHLLDATRGVGGLSTPRHRFHRDHRPGLSLLLGIAVATGLSAAWSLPGPVQRFGAALSLAVMVYLASAQRFILPTLPKEPAAGILYAAGIWGAPILVGAHTTEAPFLAAGLLGLAATLNLTVLGIFEADSDLRDGYRSLALRWGETATRKAVLWTAGVAAALGLGLIPGHPAHGVALTVLSFQVAAPGLILVGERWFRAHERYRLWGDAVFLLGALPRLLRWGS